MAVEQLVLLLALGTVLQPPDSVLEDVAPCTKVQRCCVSRCGATRVQVAKEVQASINEEVLRMNLKKSGPEQTRQRQTRTRNPALLAKFES